ncbi:DksA/TraR family C4-type zinc finger protein [Guyparkeria hydrothermalis]|uniref:DksA/TraR family C4-type zinc finger protein n=1 Tax=Guyparkeria hydrothermalis TaxID=923 RepID=UPI00202135AC|nr:DksA/TraR family C4-type zinc finger protein [Guyparkeria hydrothermalis]MCL7743575.1 DksA/TraR family C4-type zinc finger protein [Guyparkeria hydrothermalis]
MAGGWAKDGAEQAQIDDTVNDALARVRADIPEGESLEHCEECDEVIPEARRRAVPGVRLCVSCQTEQDEQSAAASPYNRRGSKDSQLR